MIRWLRLLMAGLLLLPPGVGGGAEPPSVVASIAPVHALVARVMAGAGVPRLLVPPAASPHSYALRPSDARALAEAALVVWVGPGLERRLARAIESLATGEELRLAEAPGLVRLPMRNGGHGGMDGARRGHAEVEEASARHGHGGRDDPHYWLDPVNARLWLGLIAEALGRVDPARAPLYEANAAKANRNIRALEKEIAARLAPLGGRPFVVLHDAYRYFEHRFGLEALAAVIPADDRPPGPARVAEVRRMMVERQVRCLLRVPGEGAALASRRAEAAGARVVVLDPIGRGITPGPGLYPRLLRALAEGFAACLG